MLEISGLASNMVYFETSNKKDDPTGEIRGLLEIILIVSEPTHTQDQLGGSVRFRQTENLRFGGDAKAMRNVAEYILERTKELEAAENRINQHAEKLP